MKHGLARVTFGDPTEACRAMWAATPRPVGSVLRCCICGEPIDLDEAIVATVQFHGEVDEDQLYTGVVLMLAVHDGCENRLDAAERVTETAVSMATGKETIATAGSIH